MFLKFQNLCLLNKTVGSITGLILLVLKSNLIKILPRYRRSLNLNRASPLMVPDKRRECTLQKTKSKLISGWIPIVKRILTSWIKRKTNQTLQSHLNEAKRQFKTRLNSYLNSINRASKRKWASISRWPTHFRHHIQINPKSYKWLMPILDPWEHHQLMQLKLKL